MKKKNILFAIADDASHFGIYGHDFVKTPNIDFIGKNGVIFENAFTSNPKCAPSRASILTGKYTWELKEGCNHFGEFPQDQAVYTDILEEHGYFVGYTGKGWAPGEYGTRKRNPAGTCYSSVVLVPPENSQISQCDYAGNFQLFLQDWDRETPFCFWYGGNEPHRAYSFGEGLRAGKKMSDMKHIPSYLPDTDEVRIDFLDYASEIEWFDMQLGKMMNQLEAIGELENTYVIVTSDNGCAFPRIKGQMYEQDFHLPMVASCIGFQNAGRRVKDFINFADIAPTILELCEVNSDVKMTGKSFAKYITEERKEWFDRSRNVAYLGREKHDLGRENDLGYPVRCIRTERYLLIKNYAPDRWPAGNPETGYTNVDTSPTKRIILEEHEKGNDWYYNLAFGKRPALELYDIISDEECMDNLAYSENYVDIRNELEKRLEAFLIETGDPRLTIEENYFEQFSYVGADNHSWKAYQEGRWSKQTF